MLDLCDGSQLIKDVDAHMVTTRNGNDVFVIRKLDDKSLGMRKARMNGGGYVKDFVKGPFNFGNVVYADIDV